MKKDDRTVKIEQPDGATLAIAGTENDFRVPIRTFRVAATELELLTSYEGGPTQYIVGKCKLQKHDQISIIGYNEAKTAELDLTIRGADITDFGAQDHTEAEEGPHTAFIGYIEKDVEIGDDSGFFLELRVSRRTLDHLAQAIREGMLERLHIGVKSLEIYIAGYDWYAYPSMSVGWYLRPQKHSGRTDFPETANGHLHQMIAVHRKIPAALHAKPDKTAGQAEKGAPMEDEDSTLAAVSERESRRTDALMSTAKSLERFPWLIGAALLIGILA